MKKRIVFITDCIDVAYNELRGVILDNIKSDEIIIEPVAPVAPLSIINGNFVLRLMADAYPEGTVFSVILNPSQERPAREAGISYITLVKIERSNIQNPKLETLIKLAKALGVSLDKLVGSQK